MTKLILRILKSSEFLKSVGWLFTVVIPISVYFRVDWEGYNLTTQAGLCCLLLMCTVFMWIFRLVPAFVPGIFLILGSLFLGIAPVEIVLSGYASETFFMALSILALSGVIIKSRLSDRVILHTLKKGPKNKHIFSGTFLFLGGISTLLIPSTNARASILSPFMNEVTRHIKPNSLEHQRIVAALLGGLTLLTSLFLSAKPINLLVWAMLSDQDRNVFDYSFWVISAAVPVLILVVFYLIAMCFLFWNNQSAAIKTDIIEKQFSELPKLGKSEVYAFITLLVFIVLIMTHSIHHISMPLVSLLIFFSLVFFQAVNNKQLSSMIDWSFMLFFGALIGFTKTIHYLGIDQLLASNMHWLAEYSQSNFQMLVLQLAALIFVLRLFLPINSVVILVAGVMVPTAAIYGISPWLLGFIILFLSESFIFPYQASYYLLVESILGKDHFAALTSSRVYFLNFIVFIFKILAIYLSVPYWQLLGLI